MGPWGYNYVITDQGQVEYALDDMIAAYHAGFKDPDDSEGLEEGQYWNNHYLAICLVGWFAEDRPYRDADAVIRYIPNHHTTPSAAQSQALFDLIQQLRQKYDIPVENVRGHRELTGNSTVCPGQNFDPAELRARLREAELPPPEVPVEVNPGEHVILLPDTDKYLQVALTYVWKFQPDVSFSIAEARGRWDYVTAVGSQEEISDSQLALLRSGGAKLVQRVPGSPSVVRTTLDDLVQQETRFLVEAVIPPGPEPKPPEPEPQSYTIQPGDTLSSIAKQFYGKSHLWRLIFEANQDILSEPSRIRPGQTIKIPSQPQEI